MRRGILPVRGNGSPPLALVVRAMWFRLRSLRTWGGSASIE
jgi:hypothetical protein